MDTSRQELVSNAVLFLNDPKVQSSSLTSRIQFLESKGLTDPEIQQALQQANAETPGVAAFNGPIPERPRESAPKYGYTPVQGGYGQLVAPEPPKKDWRDMFIMAMISGGVVYGLATLARKYLVPHLRPPSTTAFQETSTSLTAQYDEATHLLSELTEQTTNMQKSLEDDKERVEVVVRDVEDALQSLRDGEERWRGEMRDIRGEVESVKELVPRARLMIEKHSQTQSSVLADLQAEIRSLKALLVSRQSQSVVSPSGSTHLNGSHSPTSTTAAANALLGPRQGKTSIPVWQMAPSASVGGSSTASGINSPDEKSNGEGEKQGGDDR
nr:hypothetical protein L203_02321 [Cryptococcus depauperatus CBS 7841]